jgi:Na+/proline symporter
MTVVVALIGAKALYLLFIWLGSAIIASWLSDRKGYGERPGLATGLLLSVVAIIVWLLWPPKADSKWKLQGALPFMKGSGQTVAEARARGVGDDTDS